LYTVGEGGLRLSSLRPTLLVFVVFVVVVVVVVVVAGGGGGGRAGERARERESVIGLGGERE
jgi:ABC-type transporter Mla subunit MlaD